MPNQEQAREYGHYHSVVFQKSIQRCLSLILRRDQTTGLYKESKGICWKTMFIFFIWHLEIWNWPTCYRSLWNCEDKTMGHDWHDKPSSVSCFWHPCVSKWDEENLLLQEVAAASVLFHGLSLFWDIDDTIGENPLLFIGLCSTMRRKRYLELLTAIN